MSGKRKQTSQPKKRKKVQKTEPAGDDHCSFCHRKLTEVEVIPNISEYQKERNTIKDPAVLIEGSDAGDIPQFKLANFFIFDKLNHLVSFNCESLRGTNINKNVYFAGEVKQVVADDDDDTPGIKTVSTAITETSVVQTSEYGMILTTEMGEYNLVLNKPADEYKNIFEVDKKFAELLHVVIQRFQRAHEEGMAENYEFENLCEDIDDEDKVEFLFNYSGLLAVHLASYNYGVDVDDKDDFSMANIPAANRIVELGTGNDDLLQKRTRNDGLDVKTDEEDGDGTSKKMPAFTTDLVSDTFTEIFSAGRCLDDDSDFDDEGDDEAEEEVEPAEVISTINGWTTFRHVLVGADKVEIKPGMFVELAKVKSVGTIYGHVIAVGRKEKNNKFRVHIQRVEEDRDILAPLQAAGQFFKVRACENQPLRNIKEAKIEHRKAEDLEIWRRNNRPDSAESEQSEESEAQPKDTNFWRFYHDSRTGTITYPSAEEVGPSCYCHQVQTNNLASLKKATIPETEDRVIIAEQTFECGSFMYLRDDADKVFGIEYKYAEKVSLPKVPHRNNTDYFPHSEKTWDPYLVVQIKSVNKFENTVTLRVLCRPENTGRGYLDSRRKSMCTLYICKNPKTVSVNVIREYVEMHCRPHVVSGTDKDELISWCYKDPNRFFVTETFEPKGNIFKPLSCREAKTLGIPQIPGPPATVTPVNPLNTLDIFAGAGGLSTGLEESGAINCKWAIEFDFEAAEAYKLNHPSCQVMNKNANYLLRKLKEDPDSPELANMPNRDEVDCIVGGPPCQGFSVMNTNPNSLASKSKNDQMKPFLGFVDHYRPRYVILENVANLSSNENGKMLKFIQVVLVKMHYQVTFSVLQAGHYGVAQTRRRLIVIAAAPGEKLPVFPEPEHVFPTHFLETVPMGGIRLQPTFQNLGAPRRAVTPRDIMADLPPILAGHSNQDLKYLEPKDLKYLEPSCLAKYYFRRSSGNVPITRLNEHISKKLSDLNQTRVNCVPGLPGSDWRDIPNEEVMSPGGRKIKSWEFPYSHQFWNGKTRKYETQRGVCNCIKTFWTGTKHICDPLDNRKDRIIPWFLPHTAHKRSNSWAHTFGRIPWDGILKTTLTSPELTGKQGQVIHPEQNRICSVREFARSQGFRDDFKFFGDINDKHRQVGNAVPPPMGRAIGDELHKCLR